MVLGVLVVVQIVCMRLMPAARYTPPPPPVAPAAPDPAPPPPVVVPPRVDANTYVRVEWADADAYLRTLPEFSGADGYARELLAERPRFVSSSFAERPFFLWRADFYEQHRPALRR